MWISSHPLRVGGEKSPIPYSLTFRARQVKKKRGKGRPKREGAQKERTFPSAIGGRKKRGGVDSFRGGKETRPFITFGPGGGEALRLI